MEEIRDRELGQQLESSRTGARAGLLGAIRAAIAAAAPT